jgi:Delta3-Delta2-enoyl-CoA isomerase
MTYHKLIINIGTMTTIKDQVLELFHKLPDADKNMLFELRGNRLWITFNRPKRFNAFTFDMYDKLAKKIIEVNNDDRVKFIIFSGNGGNFSSGNDLNNFALGSTLKATVEEISQATADIIYDMTNALIHSEKPLFAITEGKVIGFSLTQLPLHDKVFAVEGSEYNAPLVKLAQGPELCSSYTFPKRFGQSLGE